MDQTLLVDERIENGQELLELLRRDRFDVLAACWAKLVEPDQWKLFVVSRLVDEKGLAAAYRAVHPAIRHLSRSWFSLSEFQLLGTTNALAAEILELCQRNPGPAPARARGPRLGSLAIEELWVYPPAE